MISVSVIPTFFTQSFLVLAYKYEIEIKKSYLFLNNLKLGFALYCHTFC